MSDPLQHALHAAALNSPALRAAAVFCAGQLLFVMALGLAASLLGRRQQITCGLLLRMAVSGLVAAALTVGLGHLVADPRPYLAEHYRPLATVAADNGFPSDHALVAALLTGWAAALDRRMWPVFAAGLLAVMLGRLAIGAHHTLDVLGSVVFAAAGLGAASRWRPAWHARPLLPRVPERS